MGMYDSPLGKVRDYSRWHDEYYKALTVAIDVDRCQPCRRHNGLRSRGVMKLCDLHERLLSRSYQLQYGTSSGHWRIELEDELCAALDDWNERFRKPSRPRAPKKPPCPHDRLSIYRYVILSSTFGYHAKGINGHEYLSTTNCGTGDDVRYDVHCFTCDMRRTYDFLHPLPERFAALLRRFPEEVREDDLLEEIQARRPTIFWNTERGRI